MPKFRSYKALAFLAMTRHALFVCAALLFLCVACDSGEKGEAKDAPVQAREDASQGPGQSEGAPESGARVLASDKNESETKAYAALPEASQALSAEERQKADKILAFANRAQKILGETYYAQAERLNELGQNYRRDWQLPKHTRVYKAPSGRYPLTPQKGIFDEREEADLSRALEDMDRHMGALVTEFQALEKYVADASIIDNGKKGLELTDKISRHNASFMAARKSWLAIVEARAQEAQNALLREHPLQRQIICANRIVEQMRQIDSLAQANAATFAVIEPVRQNLDALLAEAGAPPFPAAPALERLYRAFLKQAHAYESLLARNMAEGFFGVQKRELRDAMLACIKAWNAFALAANQNLAP